LIKLKPPFCHKKCTRRIIPQHAYNGAYYCQRPDGEGGLGGGSVARGGSLEQESARGRHPTREEGCYRSHVRPLLPSQLPQHGLDAHPWPQGAQEVQDCEWAQAEAVSQL